jgi:hypothetical protein
VVNYKLSSLASILKIFIDGVLRWLEEAKRAVASSGVYSKKFMDDFHTVSF